MDVEGIKNYLGIFYDKLAASFPGYEQRDQQIAMVNLILNGFYKEKHVVVEAGTGTGKSLAYLLAILAFHATGNKKKVVISTYTINLQEQLLHKDIPLLQDLLSPLVSFKAVLAKGRSNYLCKRRLREVLLDENFGFSSLTDAQDFDRLRDLLYRDGEYLVRDRTELAVNVSQSLWDTINASQDTCLERRCPLFKECFFRAAREELKEADIIISNHALFFVDLSLRGSAELDEAILPAYDYVIFDEAHHIEDAAASALSIQIDGYRLRTIGGKFRALLNKGTLKERLANDPLLAQQIEAVMRVYFNDVERFLRRLQEISGHEKTLRLRPGEQADLEEKLYLDLTDVLQYCDLLMDTEQLSEEESAELEKARNTWTTLKKDIDFISQLADESFVYWIESNQQDYERGAVYAAPIQLADTLRAVLFEREVVTVLTSATLASPTLEFLTRRLGIERGSYYGKVLSSPFDHDSHAAIYLPENAQEPSYQNNAEYERYLGELIFSTCSLVKGGTFVLFTSYQMLNNVHQLVGDELLWLGLEVLKQGDLPRHELLKRYAEQGNAVLFGTSSFWEGVDVVGDALRCVIITKLPFSVPDHPLTEARMEALSRQGQNPFMSYQVPEAVIRLKQGYGRLIRTQTDSGVVVIADARVKTKRYGRLFLESLPSRNIIYDRPALERFLAAQQKNRGLPR
jgi:ATP-dependent DNA helicase DinG